MTRQEFFDNIEDFDDLKEVCYDYGCGICEDVYDSDELDDWIDDHTDEWAANSSWRDLRDRLAAIPTGYDYYSIDDYDYIYGLGNQDFETYKSNVADWMDAEEQWEEDDEEEPLGVVQSQPADEPAPEEDFSISELMIDCQNQLQTIPIAEEADEEDMFDVFGGIPFN